MTLFKPRLDVSIEKIASDDHGRYILTEIVIDNTKIILVTLFFLIRTFFIRTLRLRLTQILRTY